MMNTFCGIGRIANDLQLTKTSSGKTVLVFTLAIDKRNKKQLEERNEPGTNFIKCVAWETTAQTISGYCHKGSPLGITGSVETRSYQHPQHSEVKVAVTEILVDRITFLEPKQQTQNQFATVDDKVKANVSEDMLPF